MIATIVNAIMVLLGSAIGILFKSKIKEEYTNTLMAGMALCVMFIGISSVFETSSAIHLIICMVIGILLGELLKIEDRLDNLGNFLKRKFIKSGGESSRFTEGFVAATLLFCVGSMAIMGSLEAGINHNYTIILSKSIIDAVAACTLAATLGIGVAFSAAGVLVYQGAITLLASVVAPYLNEVVVAEMTAVGGLVVVGIGLNMLGIGQNKIKVGNMLPCIFMPLVYIPLYNLITGLF